MYKSHVQAVKDLYKAWSSVYDDSTSVGIHYLAEKNTFIREVDPKKGEYILDIGCGTGRNIGELLKYTSRIEGADVSVEMLVIAKRKFPKVKFFEANLEESLPVKGYKYDKITCSLTFQFLKNIIKPLQELHRVLKPHGKVFITDFISEAPLVWSDVEYRIDRIFKGSPQSVSLFRSKEEYERSFKETGFILEKVVPLPIGKEAKSILTDKSYKKLQDKWATIIFVLTKN